jgi:hypothetical protein
MSQFQLLSHWFFNHQKCICSHYIFNISDSASYMGYCFINNGILELGKNKMSLFVYVD